MTEAAATATRTPRVLLLGNASVAGAPDCDLRELGERLPDARVVVVAPKDGGDSRRARSESGGLRPLELARLTSAIRAEARGADVVDVHAPRYALAALITGGLRDRRVVVHFDSSSLRPRPRSAAQRVRSRVREALDGVVYRHASLVVADSGPAQRALIERYGVNPWRVRTMRAVGQAGPNAAATRAATRAKLGLPSEAFVVCHVDAPVERSEADLLLAAWRALIGTTTDRGGYPMRLLLASAGDARRGLTASRLTPDLEESVTVVGPVGEPDLADLLAAADVNLALSLAERTDEAAGLAASVGTPSVAVGAHAVERLSRLDDSLVLSSAGSQALTERLAAAAAGELPSRSSTRDWAGQRRWDRIVDQHQRLYREAIDDSRPGARKIRVLYLGHVAQLSGAEIALVRLIEGLDEIDAHVVLAEDGPLVARLQSSGATVEVMPLRERTRDLRKDRVRPSALPLAAVLDTALYVLRLVRRIRAIRPDVVHANTLKAGIYGSLAARIARVPVVWHVRDRIAPDYLRRSTVALLRALIATLPDSVVVNSESTGRTLWRARGGAHAIHSPIPDPVRWLPVDRRTASDRFVVGMIGRIAPWKGQHVFLDAFARAFADGDETAILVGAAMFGGAEAEYETALREQARTLGIADRVTFRGFRSDVWRELVEMHVLVHASVVPEPFGQVVVEAMLAGTPVIATIGGGPSEIVTPEVDGLLVPPGNVGALADALCRLCADAGLRARLARNARVRAQDFSPARSGAAFKAVYTRLLRSREI